MRKPVRYLGTLNAEIVPEKLGRNSTLAQLRAVETDILKRRIDKLRTLCMHYGISNESDPEAYFKLALSLASEHVPGFRIARKKGAKMGSSRGVRDGAIFVAVADRKQEKNETTIDACKYLAWHDPRFMMKRNTKALVSAYNRIASLAGTTPLAESCAEQKKARRTLVEALVHVQLREKIEQGCIPDWNSTLLDLPLSR